MTLILGTGVRIDVSLIDRHLEEVANSHFDYDREHYCNHEHYCDCTREKCIENKSSGLCPLEA